MAATRSKTFGDLLAETTRHRSRFGYAATRDLVIAVAGVNTPQDVPPKFYARVIAACRGDYWDEDE